MSLVRNEDFKITKGEDKLKLYKFHSKIAQHFFAQFVAFIHITTRDPTSYDRI